MWSRTVYESFLVAVHPLQLFSRSTYILKRRLPLPRFKEHLTPEFIQSKLKDEHQEYICLESGWMRKYPHVEVVLTDIVEDLGQRGQIVKCKPIFAYDLVILGKAMYATPENLKKIQLLADEDIEKYSSLTAYKTMKMLRQKVLSVHMNMNEPWTIEPWHIRTNYRMIGVLILSDDCIQLPEKPISGPNLSCEGKDFAVFISINNHERFPVRCRLRHYTKIFSERIVLPPDHDCVPSEPILPEQKELLDSIPLPVYVEEEKMA